MNASNRTLGTSSLAPDCEARWLGTVPYAEALALQEELVRRRAADEIPDQLLLLEHPHVLTLGRAGKSAHVLVDRARLAQLGVELFETGRGGDVTYHGPGQLIAYPILNLAPDRCDLHRYVRDLERVLLAVLADYGVHGHIVPGRTGVWVGRDDGSDAKVGAIGVRVARWITSHGIALNVRTELRWFDLIVPCGIAGSAVTSLAELVESGPRDAGSPAGGPGGEMDVRAGDVREVDVHEVDVREVDVRAVATRFATHFATVFERRLLQAEASPPQPRTAGS